MKVKSAVIAFVGTAPVIPFLVTVIHSVTRLVATVVAALFALPLIRSAIQRAVKVKVGGDANPQNN